MAELFVGTKEEIIDHKVKLKDSVLKAWLAQGRTEEDFNAFWHSPYKQLSNKSDKPE